MEEYSVQSYGNDVYMHLLNGYKTKIESILNNEKIPLFLREFYGESPNWYTNQDMYNIIDSILWLTYNDQDKEEILNRELLNYFNLE